MVVYQHPLELSSGARKDFHKHSATFVIFLSVKLSVVRSVYKDEEVTSFGQFCYFNIKVI